MGRIALPEIALAVQATLVVTRILVVLIQAGEAANLHFPHDRCDNLPFNIGDVDLDDFIVGHVGSPGEVGTKCCDRQPESGALGNLAHWGKMLRL
jgi:hypothetical protein